MKNKSLTYIMAASLLAGVCLASCSSNPNSLCSSDITKKCNQQLKDNAGSQFYHDIEIGTYEISENDYCQLKRLEANKIIKLNITRYIWWEKVTNNRDDKAHYTYNDHYVAIVQLDSKGKRIAVEELPNAVDPLAGKKVDESSLPEYKVTDDWATAFPEIENPFLATKEEQTADKEVAPTAKDNENKIVETYQYSDEKAKNDYEAIAPTFHRDTIHLEAFALKAVKARDILLIEENGTYRANANVIIEFQDVTPIGRMYENVIEGYRMSMPVQLEYYPKEGWELLDLTED